MFSSLRAGDMSTVLLLLHDCMSVKLFDIFLFCGCDHSSGGWEGNPSFSC